MLALRKGVSCRTPPTSKILNWLLSEKASPLVSFAQANYLNLYLEDKCVRRVSPMVTQPMQIYMVRKILTVHAVRSLLKWFSLANFFDGFFDKRSLL
jgi:hypothetical protein